MNQKTFCVADAFCHAHKLFSLFIIKRKKTSSDADHVIHFPVVLVKDKVFKLSKVPTGVLVYFLFFFFWLNVSYILAVLLMFEVEVHSTRFGSRPLTALS